VNYAFRRGAGRDGPWASAGTREAVEAARQDFDDVIATGGETTDYFLDEKRKGLPQTLRELSVRTTDRRLSAAVLEVSISLHSAWSLATPRRARVINLHALSSPSSTAEIAAQIKWDLQVDVCRTGLEQCEVALTRLNELERKA
jgi:hypothetical protein